MESAQRPYVQSRDYDADDDSNRSGNRHFNDVVAASRRRFLAGGVTAAVGTMLATPLARAALPQAISGARYTGHDPWAKYIPADLPARPGFQPIAVSRANEVVVPPGYTARAMFSWGEPITGDLPEYRDGGANTGAEQEQQIGAHHDGMHFFPLPHARPGQWRGLLVMNHEYVDAPLHPNGFTLTPDNKRPADEVRKEIAAHGVSVLEIRQQDGEWSIRRDGYYNRRITAATEMAITGPAAGHPKMRTKFSPDGTRTRGTLNNCGNGYTPWGTYLTCEENWAGYFVNTDAEQPREHARYGVPDDAGRYGWETVEERFDASAKAGAAAGDYRNEPNTFGWIVEIDPFSPNSMPKKRTAMGRFAHEGCVFAPVRSGRRMAFYSGCDSSGEYIYKFVTRAQWFPWPIGVRRDALDSGTLYVARFNDDGTGEWLPLDFDDPGFQAAAAAAGVEFADQGDVLINTRLAADVVGATPMDRPEWGAVDPRTGLVYFTLTNNSGRSEADAANPRAPNPTGHIVRWRETDDDHSATTFEWDLFLLAGDASDSSVTPAGGAALDEDNILASPDGLWVDGGGLLWIQTDMSGSQLREGPFGNNQMLAADPETGEIRRFLAGPVGCEVTGITATPDLRTLFVNIQHPTDAGFPDGGDTTPRSCTIVITKDDGGVIGT